ncbi:MAG TPA: hypothetical protein VEZ91_02400 [Kurthia gibsonii]|nr:hypothetical protein [Kurthia gibsonii]
MPCRSCLVLELEFEIQLMSKENQTVIPSIQQFFKRRQLELTVEKIVSI